MTCFKWLLSSLQSDSGSAGTSSSSIGPYLSQKKLNQNSIQILFEVAYVNLGFVQVHKPNVIREFDVPFVVKKCSGHPNDVGCGYKE